MNNASDREVAAFNAALQLAVEQRAACLDRACAGDPALRLRVEALLRVHDEVGTFLENVTQESGGAAAPLGSGGTIHEDVSSAERTGDRIGRYKLLQQIGEGGCGVVYMAEQEEPVRRKVALKVIKLGMDTKHVIARFEAERQALALMDHPNIAKVLDAGTTDTGRPFFVMELVRGIKITQYCDQNQLTTGERLKIFTQVCYAIHHAHQKGIIHRDIKPSNILVADHDGVPVPKVIDFGIAKATTGQRLTEKTLFTALEQFMGTPASMSPEQATLSGLDIDTRTDIYSLGVLLYELLTGNTPFDGKKLLAAGLEEMRRTIREQEPERPSTALSTMLAVDLAAIARQRQSDAPKLVHLVRGDLDWIVMKALEKDRSRRYETVNGLAMDVQRHLDNEPVVACPPSKAYRFQKLVRRNKFAVTVVGIVTAALMLGAIGTTFGLVRADRQRRAAEVAQHLAQENFDQARVAIGDLLAVTDQDLIDRPGLNPLCVKLRRTAIDHYRTFLERPSADPSPRAELSRLYVAYAFAASFDGADYNKVALPAYQSALAIQKQLVREHPENLALRSDLGWTYFFSAWGGDLNDSKNIQARTQAIEVFEGLVHEKPADPQTRSALAWALWTRYWGANSREGDALLERALAIWEQLVKEFPRSAEFRRDLANAIQDCAGISGYGPTARLTMLSRASELRLGVVADMERHAAEIELPLCPPDSEALLLRPKIMWVRKDLAQGYLAAARQEIQLEQWEEAIAMSDRATEINRELVAQNPSILQFRDELTLALISNLTATEHLNQAVRRSGKIVEAKREVAKLAADCGDAAFLNTLAWTLATSVDANVRDGSDAIHIAERAVAITMRKDAPTLNTLAAAYAESHQFGKAVNIQKQAIELLADKQQEHNYVSRLKLYESNAPYRDASSLADKTSALLNNGDFVKAEQTARECLAICEQESPDDWRTFNTRSLLGGSLLGQKKYTESEPLLLSGYEGMKQRENQITAAYKARLRESLERLVQLFEATSRLDTVSQWKQKLAEFDRAEIEKKNTALRP